MNPEQVLRQNEKYIRAMRQQFAEPEQQMETQQDAYLAHAMQQLFAAQEQQMMEQQDEDIADAMQRMFAEVEHAAPEQVHRNRGAKSAEKTPEQLERLRERRRLQAERRDRRTVQVDKMRHGFYSVVKGVVTGWKSVTGQLREQRNVRENTPYMRSLRDADQEMYAMWLQAELNGELDEFYAKHGDYYMQVTQASAQARKDAREQVLRENNGVFDQQAYERALDALMLERQMPMRFGVQQRANVVGGTKPAAVQYAENGSKWLVKESVSCIGINDPFAAIVTEAGYKVQKLVNPDTAIEAFRGQSIGRGVVSYQRMVQGVKQDVDLFKFSRTPEAMTDAELRRVQELSPQLLREHTTDWLLCNFDTKGENFIIANDGTGPDRVYGIDKEASFRAINDPGAQHMSKDYQRFDQNTVYNRLFQKFADGSMDLDLQTVTTQIERVEAMSDAEYMDIFRDFLAEKQREFAKTPQKFEQVRDSILARKRNLRIEYRDFFTQLVEERCTHVTPEEQRALRERYFGSADGGTFIFRGETAAQLQAERQQREENRLGNIEELTRRAREADEKDEKSYKRRHALYDFSKTVVMGFKKIASKFQKAKEEQRVVQVPLSQVNLHEIADQAYRERVQQRIERLRASIADAQALTEQMAQQTIELRMSSDHEIFLGGTKPMSEYIAADGSQWLAKQAVNCMGYYKISGALLTEAGANLQKIVHPETAVDAFVGRTKKHGDVSFQRRLSNVESGPDKLDLFKFSKHPELATQDTIRAVEQLGPQILREHTTDWLLCNFDTKGENFIITLDENQQRVLHGIDKEAAFNKILSPDAQHMSRTYQPHANNTLYNVVFSMFAENRMDLDLFAVLPQIQRIEAMDDQSYMALYDGYLDHVKQEKKFDEATKIQQAVLARKTGLRERYREFFTQLVLERCKRLHPDEAAQLKQRYFGTGSRFHFPGET